MVRQPVIKDHQVRMSHAVGELAGLAAGIFLLECIDEFDGREEPDPPLIVNHSLDGDREYSGAVYSCCCPEIAGNRSLNRC